MIELIIIIVILIYFFMKKQKSVYDVAYDLGVNYLDTIEPQDNFAVMFDIDDTLLFSKNLKPIKPIIKLIDECNKRNIQVLIITARSDTYNIETINNLLDINVYPNPDQFADIYEYFGITKIPKGAVFYDFYYLRHSPQDDNEQFKSRVKEQLSKNGLFTIMSIGDNDIDVLGKYSGYTIKLPNINEDDERYDPRLFHKNTDGKMVHIKV